MKNMILVSITLALVIMASGCVSESQQECSPSWSCTEWTDCINSKQTRTCTDANECGSDSGKPNEIQSCESSSENFLDASVFNPYCTWDKIENQGNVFSARFTVINTGEKKMNIDVDYEIWKGDPNSVGQIVEEGKKVDYVYSLDVGKNKTETVWIGFFTKEQGEYYIRLIFKEAGTADVLAEATSPACEL